MNTSQQNEDGSWTDAQPLAMQGWKAKLELFFWRVKMKRAASFMARWDERTLGR